MTSEDQAFLRTTLVLLVSAVTSIALLLPFDAIVVTSARHVPGFVHAASSAISDAGRSGWMIAFSGVAAVFCAGRAAFISDFSSRHAKYAAVFAYVFTSTAAANLTVHVAKYLVGRSRPVTLQDVGAYEISPFALEWVAQSFPSGHSAAIAALAGACSFMVPRNALAWLSFALAIGITRVIVGAHYPSDVAAGLFLGLWIAVAISFVFARKSWVFEFDKMGWPRVRSDYLEK